MTPRFIQLHLLVDHTAVLLNRDDNGAAKRITVGEAMRTRVSSQCFKRHLRDADGEFALANIVPDAVRTKDLADTLIHAEIQRILPDVSDQTAQSAVEALNIGLYGRDGNDEKKRSVLLFGRPEIEWLTESVTTAISENSGNEREAVQAIFNGRDAEKNFSAYRSERVMPAGLVGAMFGRMVAHDRKANIDSALHVAHAFTTHGEESEIDFFTAIDDLRMGLDQAGSGFMGNTELNSGVFYFYICIDVPTLVSNTTGHHAKDWLEADRTVAAQAAANIAALAATTSPGAKKGSTAPYSYAQAMLVEAGERQPRTLAGAFTEPARPNVPDSLRKMTEHLAQYDRMYGEHEARIAMNPAGDTNLAQVHAWIHRAVLSGQTA